MKIFAGIMFVVAAIVGVYINNYNDAHVSDPIAYSKGIIIGLSLIGMFFLMPWKEDRKKN